MYGHDVVFVRDTWGSRIRHEAGGLMFWLSDAFLLFYNLGSFLQLFVSSYSSFLSFFGYPGVSSAVMTAEKR